MKNRFQAGVGTYVCQSCSRRTRPHGGDPSAIWCRLCEECYELSGLSNQLADEGGFDKDAAMYYIRKLIGFGVDPNKSFPELMEHLQ